MDYRSSPPLSRSSLLRYNRDMPRAREAKKLMALYQRLRARFGPQHWWPKTTPEGTRSPRHRAAPLEVLIGAILTQNTAWENVAKAINNLKAATELTLPALLALPEARLAALIRPSGYFRQKAARLHGFLRWLDARGDWERWLKKTPLDEARAALLAVKGIGPETADSMLLYGAARHSFVVDAYTLRIGARYGLFAEGTKYAAAREWCMERLPADAALYNEFHALIVRLGATTCKKKPLCHACPIAAGCAYNKTREAER